MTHLIIRTLRSKRAHVVSLPLFLQDIHNNKSSIYKNAAAAAHHRRHITTTPPARMRVPYVSNPPPTTTPEDAAIVERITARRHPRPLQPLDLALLHSPPVADGWNSFLGAVRTKTTLGADVRELAISRVAVVNRAWYEWGHHAPLAVQAGVSESAMEAVKKEGPLRIEDRPAELTEEQWASVVIADEMTRNVQVSDETFAKVKGLFGEKGTVEVVATVACYNCVSRFLVALDGKFDFFFLSFLFLHSLRRVGLWVSYPLLLLLLLVLFLGLLTHNTLVGERNGTGPEAVH